MKGTAFTGLTEFSDIIFIRDYSETSYTKGLTGLTSTSITTAYYVRPGSSAQAITLSALTTVSDAYTSGGFIEIDATNMPGFYRIDWPIAIFSEGVRAAFAVLSGATNMEPVRCQWDLKVFEQSDSSSDSRLVNVSEATSPSEIQTYMDANSQIATDTSSIVTVTDKLDTALEDDGASGYQLTETALENAPTGTGSSDITSINGTALTEATTGNLANAFSYFYDVDTPSKTIEDVGGSVSGTVDANIVSVQDTNVTTVDDFKASSVEVSDKTGFSLSGTKTTLDDLRDFDPDTDIMENEKTFAQLWRRGLAWLCGNTTNSGATAYGMDGTTTRGTVSISDSNRTFTNSSDD